MRTPCLHAACRNNNLATAARTRNSYFKEKIVPLKTGYIHGRLISSKAPSHSQLTVLSEAKEEVAIFEMVFIDHVMYVVSGDQELTDFDSFLSAGRLSHANQTINKIRGCGKVKRCEKREKDRRRKRASAIN